MSPGESPWVSFVFFASFALILVMCCFILMYRYIAVGWLALSGEYNLQIATMLSMVWWICGVCCMGWCTLSRGKGRALQREAANSTAQPRQLCSTLTWPDCRPTYDASLVRSRLLGNRGVRNGG